MKNWYRSLIPGRMPLVLGWVVAFLGTAALLVWIATSIGGGILIPLRAGDTIRFEQIRQAASTTEPHHFTVEALGIDFNLDDGRFGSGEASGTLDGFEITFTEPGQFAITDSAHPRAHGRASFVVSESDGGTGRLIVTGVFEVEDGLFVLWVPQSEGQFGYDPGARVPSRSPGDQLIFFSLMGGSALASPLIARAKRRRWWLWGLFGLIGGFLGVGQPLITSATVAVAALLSEPYRPPPPDLDDDEPEPEHEDEGEDDSGAGGAKDDGPPGPPTEDQRTLPPLRPSDLARPPRPRPPHAQRRPRH